MLQYSVIINAMQCNARRGRRIRYPRLLPTSKGIYAHSRSPPQGRERVGPAFGVVTVVFRVPKRWSDLPRWAKRVFGVSVFYLYDSWGWGRAHILIKLCIPLFWCCLLMLHTPREFYPKSNHPEMHKIQKKPTNISFSIQLCTLYIYTHMYYTILFSIILYIN